MASLSSIIRARRRELRLTLDQVGGLVGCTKGYLSSIENSRRPRNRPPSPELLVRLERALMLPAGELTLLAEFESLSPSMRQHLRKLDAAARTLPSEAAPAAHGIPGRLSPEKGILPPGGERRGESHRSLPLEVPLMVHDPRGSRASGDYIRVPDDGLLDADAYAIRLTTDSMEPRFAAGDVVIFNPIAIGADDPSEHGRAWLDCNGRDCHVRWLVGDGLAGSGESSHASMFARVLLDSPVSRTTSHPRGGRLSRGEAHQIPSPHPGRLTGRKPPPPPAGEGAVRVRLLPLNENHGAHIVLTTDVVGIALAVFVIKRLG